MFGKCYRPTELLVRRLDLRTVVFSCYQYFEDGSYNYCHDCTCDARWNMKYDNCKP